MSVTQRISQGPGFCDHGVSTNAWCPLCQDARTATTSAARDENRLTTDDRDRITTAVTEFYAASPNPTAGTTTDTACRLAWHAIGCNSHDLRYSELAEIAATVDTIAARRRADLTTGANHQ